MGIAAIDQEAGARRIKMSGIIRENQIPVASRTYDFVNQSRRPQMMLLGQQRTSTSGGPDQRMT
jgi:hypothetical protein